MQCKIGKQRLAKTVQTRSAGSFRGPGADFGTPFEIRWGQKWHQNPPSGATSLKFLALCSVCFEFFGVPCSRPCFSRKHSNPRAVGTVILVPLGPSVFKNMIFSMMIGYFSVFSAFRCAMFYMLFLSHLLKKPQ